MKHPRLIVSILIHNHSLIKTRSLTDPLYLGDPLNAIRIYNQLGVDELLIIDSGASQMQYPIQYSFLSLLSSEALMPLSYAGGIRTPEHAHSIISSGFEKVYLSYNPLSLQSSVSLLDAISIIAGRQSVGAILNVSTGLCEAKRFCSAISDKQLEDCADSITSLSQHAGELLIHDICSDGLQCGHSLPDVPFLHDITCPTLRMGGISSLKEIKKLLSFSDGVVAGAFFSLKKPHNGLVLSYPNLDDFCYLSPSPLY